MRRALARLVVAAGALALPGAAGTATPVTKLGGDRISISGDGSLVAYQGVDGFSAFVVDTRTSISTRLTYVVVNGERRAANGRRPSISADGTKVLVSAKQLGTDAAQQPDQLWLVDLAGNATRVSTGLPEAPREVSLAGNASAAVFTVASGPLFYLKLGGAPVQVAIRGLNPSISGDGRKVAYLWDFTAYVWDATTGKTTAVSRTEKGVALVATIEPRISGNGRYVSFAARLPTQRYGQQAYRKDLVTGKLVQLSVDTQGREGTKAVVRTAISSSGDRVAFVTAARLTSDDTGSGSDIYVKDVSDGTLIRVAPAGPTHLVLSGDGSTVAWSEGVDGGATALFFERVGAGETCQASRFLAASKRRAQGECVELFAIEVTQGIQNLNNDVDLIKGRPTYVRVHVRTRGGAATGGRISGELHGERKGVPLPGSPRKPFGPITVRKAPKTGESGQSLLFKVPPSWLNGTITLNAAPAPGDTFECAESVDSANDCKITISFTKGPRLRLKLVEIEWTYKDKTYGVTPKDFADVVRQIEALYPVAAVEFEVVAQTVKWDVIDDPADVIALNKRVADMSSQDLSSKEPARRRPIYLGIWTGPRLDGIVLDGVAALSWGPVSHFEKANPPPGRRNSARTPAHELGHALGRQHTNCGLLKIQEILADFLRFLDDFTVLDPYPYPRALLGSATPRRAHTYHGFDIFNQTVYAPAETHDIMSYCEPRWMSAHNWKLIKKELTARFGLRS